MGYSFSPQLPRWQQLKITRGIYHLEKAGIDLTCDGAVIFVPMPTVGYPKRADGGVERPDEYGEPTRIFFSQECYESPVEEFIIVLAHELGHHLHYQHQWFDEADFRYTELIRLARLSPTIQELDTRGERWNKIRIDMSHRPAPFKESWRVLLIEEAYERGLYSCARARRTWERYRYLLWDGEIIPRITEQYVRNKLGLQKPYLPEGYTRRMWTWPDHEFRPLAQEFAPLLTSPKICHDNDQILLSIGFLSLGA